MQKKVFFLTFILLLSFSLQGLFGQSNTNNKSPEPYKDDEFSQGLKDLRRFEIITLGSIPFVTLDSAIVYNGYKFFSGKSPTFNPLATADYSQTEMERIIITSVCISAGIGLSDYIINLVKRKRINKKTREEKQSISIEENPDAVKIPLPQEKNSQSDNSGDSQ